MINYVSSTILDGYNSLYSTIYPVNCESQIEPTDRGNALQYEIPLFPQDIWNQLLHHSKSGLVAMACVSKSLNEVTLMFAKDYRPAGCIGEKEWKQYGADSVAAFPIPLKMIQDFDPTNWMLTFIPEIINGEPLTLSSIDRFVSDYKNGEDAFESNYHFSSDDEIHDHRVTPFKAHWILLSKNILGGNSIQNGTRQQAFKTIEEQVKNTGYEVPCLIDVVVSRLMDYLKTGDLKSNMHDYNYIYTIVQEKNRRGYRIEVNLSDEITFRTSFTDITDAETGACLAKKFPAAPKSMFDFWK